MQVLGALLLLVALICLVIDLVEPKYRLLRASVGLTILAVAVLHWGQRLLQ